jgi:hypothetical protein
MCFQRAKLGKSVGKTHTLIVDNDHFLYATVPTKLVVQVPFRCPDTQTKYSQHVTWVGSLEDRSICDPKVKPLVCNLRLERERDVLVASKLGCRMLDVRDWENETDEGRALGLGTK